MAFKLVAISGLIFLPTCCWAFGKLGGFRSPLPQLFAFAGMAFALQESYSIYGGNLKSTMAGEFSFSIAISLAILGLGLLAKAMQTGRYRNWAAIVLALAIVSHGIVPSTSLSPPHRRARPPRQHAPAQVRGALALAVVLLSAFWIGPFLGNHDLMTDMKYGGRPDGASDSFWDMFFPFPDPLDVLVTGLAIVGFVASVARRHLTGTALGVIGLCTVALVYLTRDSLPIIGLLWNPRLLPLLYLVEFLLAMVGAVEIGSVLAAALHDRPLGAQSGTGVEGGHVRGRGGVRLLHVRVLLRGAPGRRPCHRARPDRLRVGSAAQERPPRQRRRLPEGAGQRLVPVQLRGLRRAAEVPRVLRRRAVDEGHRRHRGCGRALWENSGDNGEYGTTMALMLCRSGPTGASRRWRGCSSRPPARPRTTS